MNAMWIKLLVIISCTAYLTNAADEHRPKIKKDARGKRNLEYSISHPYSIGSSYRLERRISSIPQISRYPSSSFFPGPRNNYNPYQKLRQHSLPVPPYAVQMEPLVHYSQRDPLYDIKTSSLVNIHNDLTKLDDLQTDNNHLNEHVAQEYPSPPSHHHQQQHYVERPVYIREPEPIIEIIIKESNVTLPPSPTLPVITPAPKKKEEVQVFYVKYKKNPHGEGKDSIIYDTPVPAISPPVKDEDEEIEEEQGRALQSDAAYSSETVYATSPRPPSTTLRAIIKPESEVFHSDHGIHVTFGEEQQTLKKEYDDADEESAPRPAISFPHGQPQGRQLNFNSGPQKRNPPLPPVIPNGPRFPPNYRPFNQQNRGPPPNKVNLDQPPPNRPSNFNTRPTNFQFNSQFQTQQSQFHFSQRQPVPYRPFDQLRPQSSNNNVSPQQQQHNQFQRPAPPPPQQQQSHFPSHQQLPLPQQQHTFAPPQQHQPENQFNRQQFTQQQQFQQQQQQKEQFQQLKDPQQQIKDSFQQPPNRLPQSNFQFPQQQFPQFSQQNQQLPQQHNFGQQPILQQQQFPSQQQFNQQLNFQYHQQNVQAFQSHTNQNGHLQPQPNQFNGFQQQQQQHNQNTHQQQRPSSIIPPGGELIASVPKYEQHISIPTNQFQQESQISQQQQQSPNNNGLSPIDYKTQIQQQFLNSQESFFGNNQNPAALQQTTQRPFTYQTAPSTTTTTTIRTTTSTTTTTAAPTTSKDKNPLNLQLPDEVPDDLREQLLNSGILANAQISILDYDKVGDIPLSALPPDQLANFYNAGGASQIAAGSAPVPSVVDASGRAIVEEDQEPSASDVEEIKINQPVEMKVVHFDPESDQGKKLKDAYVKDDATRIEPVVLNDQKYTKYLPLKVSGEQFPIPNVPELKGKNINSVVVLAPVDYSIAENTRITRDVNKNVEEVKFISGPELKKLLENPSKANFEKFLDHENRTTSDRQSVILLVTGSNEEKNKEIFMYDVSTKTVSKLNGELSSAFVEAAETNTNDQNEKEEITSSVAAASNIVETKLPAPEGTTNNFKQIRDSIDDLDEAASEYVESKVPIIDPGDIDLVADGSEQFEKFVDISGLEIRPNDDLTVAATNSA